MSFRQVCRSAQSWSISFLNTVPLKSDRLRSPGSAEWTIFGQTWADFCTSGYLQHSGGCYQACNRKESLGHLQRLGIFYSPCWNWCWRISAHFPRSYNCNWEKLWHCEVRPLIFGWNRRRFLILTWQSSCLNRFWGIKFDRNFLPTEALLYRSGNVGEKRIYLGHRMIRNSANMLN